MSAPVLCAAPGCDNHVVRVPGRVGRPPLYCSPQCRPTRASAGAVVGVEVEAVEHDGTGDRDRSWRVRLRMGSHAVVLGDDYGRISAIVLAGELRTLLHPPARQEGVTIE